MLYYPHPTINNFYLFLFLKKGIAKIYPTSFSSCLEYKKNVDRGSLVVYKGANAIMVSLLMCMASAGFDLAVL